MTFEEMYALACQRKKDMPEGISLWSFLSHRTSDKDLCPGIHYEGRTHTYASFELCCRFPV